MAVDHEALGESNIAAPEYIYLPAPGQRSLVAGHWVRPHVQAFADAVRTATRVKSIGTYNGHSPSVDLALDLFHPIGDDDLADAICAYAIKNLDRYGVDYIISRQRIYNPEIATYWRGMEDRGDNTQNHRDHVHISFEQTGGTDEPEPEPTPQPEPKKEEEMAKAALGVYDWNGQTWITDGMFTRRTNDPYIYLNAGLAEFVGEGGKLTDGQHSELRERDTLAAKPKPRKKKDA